MGIAPTLVTEVVVKVQDCLIVELGFTLGTRELKEEDPPPKGDTYGNSDQESGYGQPVGPPEGQNHNDEDLPHHSQYRYNQGSNPLLLAPGSMLSLEEVDR